MLFGSYKHTLDDKNRLLIPSKIRKHFTSKMYILKGCEGCLSLYDEKSFELYYKKLSNIPFEKKQNRDVLRITLASINELKIDKSNRIQLPIDIVSEYKINKNVILIGVVDHLELWDEQKWNEYKQDKGYEDKIESLLVN